MGGNLNIQKDKSYIKKINGGTGWATRIIRGCKGRGFNLAFDSIRVHSNFPQNPRRYQRTDWKLMEKMTTAQLRPRFAIW